MSPDGNTMYTVTNQGKITVTTKTETKGWFSSQAKVGSKTVSLLNKGESVRHISASWTSGIILAS